MCHKSCILFGKKSLSEEEIKLKRVIEVGSFDINGSLRSTIKALNPKEYVGVDILEGPGVDVVCRAENLVEKFGKESFDIVISTELLEHTKNWRKVISNIKGICKPNGTILITTRSYGFPYHGYPYDFWRYELDDIKQIFSDCEIVVLEKDPEAPGVFVKLKKPDKLVENNLSNYRLYTVLAKKRMVKINWFLSVVCHIFFLKLRIKMLTIKLRIKMLAIIGKLGQYLKKYSPPIYSILKPYFPNKK